MRIEVQLFVVTGEPYRVAIGGFIRCRIDLPIDLPLLRSALVEFGEKHSLSKGWCVWLKCFVARSADYVICAGTGEGVDVNRYGRIGNRVHREISTDEQRDGHPNYLDGFHMSTSRKQPSSLLQLFAGNVTDFGKIREIGAEKQ